MNGKNCNAYKLIIVILLLINTFFIGSIWCKLVMQCSDKKFCPITKDKSVKMCPLTGKSLNDGKSVIAE